MGKRQIQKIRMIIWVFVFFIIGMVAPAPGFQLVKDKQEKDEADIERVEEMQEGEEQDARMGG